jgi:hypothetical protein
MTSSGKAKLRDKISVISGREGKGTHYEGKDFTEIGQEG